MASFGTGPVLLMPPARRTGRGKVRLDRRDDADHAMWSFFKNAALKAAAHMSMDKRLEEQAARSGLLPRARVELKNHRHSAHIWMKVIPMVIAAVQNPLHHFGRGRLAAL